MSTSTAERHRRVRTLAFGMLTAQIAAFVATPLLTRIYDPAAFGSYAVLLSLLAIGAPVAALRFDTALVLPESSSEAWQLLLTGMKAALGVALAMAVLVWVAGPRIQILGFADQKAASLLPWLPAFLLVAGAFQLCTAWHVREHLHARAARGRAAQGILAATAQILFGSISSLSAGLVIGDLTGRIGAVLSLCSTMRRPIRSEVVIDRPALIRRYRGFATYSSGTALVNALNGALPMLVVGATLGAEAAGFLLLAQRVASLPASLLTTAVSQVLAVDLARAANAEARVELYWATIRQLMRIALPAFGVVAASAPLFGLVFGSQWHEAGLVAAALAPFYATQLLSGATIVAADVIQAHRARLARELTYLIGMLTVLLLVTRSSASLTWLALAVSAFGLSFYIFSIRWVGLRLKQ